LPLYDQFQLGGSDVDGAGKTWEFSSIAIAVWNGNLPMAKKLLFVDISWSG
jgi:hypothetical protein